MQKTSLLKISFTLSKQNFILFRNLINIFIIDLSANYFNI